VAAWIEQDRFLGDAGQGVSLKASNGPWADAIVYTTQRLRRQATLIASDDHFSGKLAAGVVLL